MMAASTTQSLAEAEQLLHEQAMASTGLQDFGDPAYRVALHAYLGGLDEVGTVTPAGAEILKAQVVNLLERRLRLQAALRANPQVLERPITAPVIVISLPRSGTTALHNLLMNDRRYQGLQTWLADYPMPRPPRETWASHPGFRQTQARLDEQYNRVEGLKAMHYMAAGEIEECQAIMAQGFASTLLSWASDTGSYERWLEQHDMTAEYQYHANALRLIGANEPDKPWLLKCPHHAISADTLLKTFPDAKIILIHRDPASVISSVSKVVYHLRRTTEGEGASRERCGEQLLHHMDFALRRLLSARDRNPRHFANLRYQDLMDDPIPSLEQACDSVGISLSGETIDRMQSWLRDNPRGKHGENRYAPEEFGLSADGIREHFSYYQDY